MVAIARNSLSRRLLATSATGALADWTVFAALVTLVAGLTGGSVFAVAIVTTARLAPSVLLSPLLAPYAGIIGTRRTLAAADAVRGTIIGVLPFVATLPRLAVALLALEFAAAMSAAARESAISAGIEPRLFAPFNTATGIATYGMLPVGGLLAAGLQTVWAGLPFTIAALLHWGGAVTIFRTAGIGGRPRAPRDVRLLDGVRRLRAPGPFRDTVAGATIGVVAIAMLFSVGPVVAGEVFGGAERYGYLLGVLGVGALVGARLVNRGTSAASGLVLAAVGSCLLVTPLAVAGVFVIGVGAAIAYVETQSRLQHTAAHPEDFAAAFAVIKIGTVVALLLAPAAHALGGTALVASVMGAVAGTGALWYARRIEGRSLATVVLTLVGRPILRAAVRIRLEGHLPDGGAVLASNHPNLLDGPLMMALDDRMRPVAHPQERPVVRVGLRWSGAIIVGRQATGAAVDHLRAGGLVWLAPEGHRTGDHFGPGRSGAARMAMAAQVPIHPVAIRYPSGDRAGAVAVGPIGTVGPRLRDWRPWHRPRVTVVVGAPISFPASTVPEEATAIVMRQLSRMTGVPIASAEQVPSASAEQPTPV